MIRNIAPLQHPTFISNSLSLYISLIQANTRSVSASTMYAMQSNAKRCMPSAPLARSGSPPRCCEHLPSLIHNWGEPERAPHLREVRHRCPYVYIYIYIYIYIFIYMCRTSCRIVLFTQNGQDGRPLRATQILATDSFKREGNRTTRSGNSNLSPRQGHRHRTKE